MVIPSIDLMAKKVVQLKQGREKVLEYDDPYKLAREFNRYNEIALIDLDAAMGRGDNFSIVKQILKIADCRVGGGIRNIERARKLLNSGANKIIIGSKAFEHGKINRKFLSALKAEFGAQRIIIALDSYNKEIVLHGWQTHTNINLFNVIKEFEEYANEFLFTFVESEGTMSGVELDIVKHLRRITDRCITIAGGVSTLDEINRLSKIGVDVQLGMALYTGKILLVDAFIESLNWKQKLLPTIAQDISGAVLMLAYSNKDSLKKTFETNQMWYFSRSRKELWCKGRISGNIQELIKLRADCDRDALLAIIHQSGRACHTGNYSCFNIKPGQVLKSTKRTKR